MYQIDEKEFYKELATKEPTERSRYVLQIAIWMVDGVLDLPWAKRIEPTQVRKPKNQGYTKAFETFWKNYPNRVGKGAAFKSWNKIATWCGEPEFEDNLLDLCLVALSWQVMSDSWKQDNGKYIPHPQTYLNQRRWEDEPPAKQTKETYIDMDGVERCR